MFWLPVIGFVLGFCIIWFRGITVPSEYASYLSLAALAGIDTILGGMRSGLEGRFKSDIFLSGFVVNTLMAALLAYFGDQIGVPDLYLAAVFVLGWRIFLNLSLIRHYILGYKNPEPAIEPNINPVSLPEKPSPEKAAEEERNRTSLKPHSPVEAP